MAGISLHFWDWHTAIVTNAVRELTRDWSGAELNLSKRVILVPTAEAGRRLREALAIAAAEKEGAVVAPFVWHPESALWFGSENLAAASSVQEQLAWMEALHVVDKNELTSLFPELAETIENAWIQGTAETLRSLKRSLGAGGHTMASVHEKLRDDEDVERWHDLEQVETCYLEVLQKLGVHDVQELKRARAAEPLLPDEVEEVWVMSTADPPALLRTWLQNVSQQVPVKIFVQAPEELSGTFDEIGTPRWESWNEKSKRPVPLRDDVLHIVSSPQEQAACAVTLLRDLAIAGAAHGEACATLAVGACDPGLNAHLEGALSLEEARAFDPAGKAASLHPLTQVIRAWQQVVQSGMWQNVSTFLRLNDVIRAVCQKDLSQIELLKKLDEFHAKHLPPTLDDAILLAHNEKFFALKNVLLHLQILAKQWQEQTCAEALRNLLEWIYGHQEFETDREQDRDYVMLSGKAIQLAMELDETRNRLGARLLSAELLSLLLRELEATRLADLRGEIDFVLHGWLELPWESAACLVITGFNEEYVPGIVTSDPFLPNALRTKLGLASQASRRARDAYLLRAMVEQRFEHDSLRIVLGKTNEQGDALRPSRLLFDCDDSELVKRVRHLFPQHETQEGEREPASTIGFKLQPRLEDKDLPSISPSAIRAYLACPFRFYLGKVLHMEQIDPALREATPMDFGNRLHEALREYAVSEAMKECMNEHVIAAWLDETLVKIWRKQYGARPLLSVEMQLESARQRLAGAAKHLAELRAQGWRTLYAEQKVKDWGLSLNGVTFSGTIDRVDRRAIDGREEFMLWDYKTGKAGKPEGAHLARLRESDLMDDRNAWQIWEAEGKRWVDVQLPLYAWALRHKHPAVKITAGYFVLPATVADIGMQNWETLDETCIDDAVRCAEEVVTRIQKKHFWPPATDVKYEEFELLLGDPLKTVDPANLIKGMLV